jgi:hypothetical protein
MSRWAAAIGCVRKIYEHLGEALYGYRNIPDRFACARVAKLDPGVSHLTDAEKSSLKHNIQLCRDAIVSFTALAPAPRAYLDTPAERMTRCQKS